MVGPMIVPAPTTALTHPKYFVLCSFGMMSAKYAKIVLMLPPVIPSIMRPANSTHKAPPIPKTKYPIAEPNKHIKSNGRRPYLSLKAPSTGATKNTQAAYTEVSSVTTNACSSGLLVYGCTKNGTTGMMILKPIPQRNTEISPNSKACLSMLFQFPFHFRSKYRHLTSLLKILLLCQQNNNSILLISQQK